MPNNVTGTCWVIDTAGVIKSGEHVCIRGLFWVSTEDSGNDIAADDDLELRECKKNQTTGLGKVFFEKRAEDATDGVALTFERPLTVEGLDVAVLDGGKLIVWV